MRSKFAVICELCFAPVIVLALTASSIANEQASAIKPLHSWRLALAIQTLQTEPADTVSRISMPGLKSENRAYNYSLLGTVLPLPTLVLAVPGVWFGPSFGYFYADRPGRAWTGIGIRTLALGGMISAFGICGWDCGPGESAYSVAWAVFLTSGGVFVGSAIYDIATVRREVRKHNASLNAVTWRVTPRYESKSGMIGLRLAHRF